MDESRKKDFQAVLDNMTEDELEIVKSMVISTQNCFHNQRRKELWDNVVKAIQNYHDEMNEQIDIWGNGRHLVPYPGRSAVGRLETCD